MAVIDVIYLFSLFSMNKIHSWIYYSLMKCILKYHDYLLCLKYHSRHCTGEADRNVFPCRIPDPVGDKEKQLAICRIITMIRLDLWLIISPIESVTKSFLKKVKKYFFFECIQTFIAMKKEPITKYRNENNGPNFDFHLYIIIPTVHWMLVMCQSLLLCSSF